MKVRIKLSFVLDMGPDDTAGLPRVNTLDFIEAGCKASGIRAEAIMPNAMVGVTRYSKR